MHMKEKFRLIFRSGFGFIPGLILGLGVMIIFCAGLGSAFFGIILGIAVALFTCIAFDCALAPETSLNISQRITLSVTAVLLIASVISAILWESIS